MRSGRAFDTEDREKSNDLVTAEAQRDRETLVNKSRLPRSRFASQPRPFVLSSRGGHQPGEGSAFQLCGRVLLSRDPNSRTLKNSSPRGIPDAASTTAPKSLRALCAFRGDLIRSLCLCVSAVLLLAG